MGNLLNRPRQARNEEQQITKRALLVGCNYPETKAQLDGCVNDVHTWKELLETLLGFAPENVKILVDDGPGGYEPATGKNIKRELKRIVHESQKGDVVFFHFSGHGVQVPADEDGDYEEDGMDEALCPTDLNLIIDDDLRDILSELDDGAKFTMISDCCHSGGMLDHQEIPIRGGQENESLPKAQIKERNLTMKHLKGEIEAMKASTQKKKRSLDVETVTQLLSQTLKKTETKAKLINMENAKFGSCRGFKNVRANLYHAYGEDASNAAIAFKTRNLGTEHASHIRYVGPGKKPTDGQIDPNKGILITGCQSHETSADVTDVEGRSFGALSHLMVKVIARHVRKYGDKKPLTNKDLVLKIRQMLQSAGFTQNPCLECSEQNAQETFVL